MPVPVSGNLTIASVAANVYHTCVVTTGGVAHCWGRNGNGELGNGTTTDSNTPMTVAGGLSFSMVAGGGQDHTCGLTGAGAAYCWGYNGAGTLGDGTYENSSVPVAVAGGHSFASLDAGGAHNCALTAAGTGYCWGFNLSGQTGDGTGNSTNVPTLISTGLSFINVNAGLQHTCAVATGGQGYCWGYNNDGELGDGTNAGSNVPVAISKVDL